jgi:hypothetical protein
LGVRGFFSRHRLCILGCLGCFIPKCLRIVSQGALPKYPFCVLGPQAEAAAQAVKQQEEEATLREDLKAAAASMAASLELAQAQARAAEARLQQAQQELVGVM